MKTRFSTGKALNKQFTKKGSLSRNASPLAVGDNRLAPPKVIGLFTWLLGGACTINTRSSTPEKALNLFSIRKFKWAIGKTRSEKRVDKIAEYIIEDSMKKKRKLRRKMWQDHSKYIDQLVTEYRTSRIPIIKGKDWYIEESERSYTYYLEQVKQLRQNSGKKYLELNDFVLEYKKQCIPGYRTR
jgi:hypothetical protein